MKAIVTSTGKETEAVLLAASVAVQVTVVDPMGKVDPEGMSHARVTPLSESSSADTLYDAAAPAALVAWTLTLAGALSTGGVVSVSQVMVTDAVPDPATIDTLLALGDA